MNTTPIKTNSRFDCLKSNDNDGFIQNKSRKTMRRERRQQQQNKQTMQMENSFAPKKKVVEKKINTNDVNQFPTLSSTSNSGTTDNNMDFKKLFSKKKYQKKNKNTVKPGWIRWKKVNGQYYYQKGDMTQVNIALKQMEERQLNTKLFNLANSLEQKKEEMIEYYGEEEYYNIYEPYDECDESITDDEISMSDENDSDYNIEDDLSDNYD